MQSTHTRLGFSGLRRPLSGFLLGLLLLAGTCGLGGSRALAQDPNDVSTDVAPPALPDYDQPPIPGDGYVWTPGYWAWSDDDQDYYWVPGTWVAAPVIGYLWTPGYWYADGGVFVWYPGYWGVHVGFYGGLNYGHGYGGRGYEGGYWQGGRLFYNRAVVNVGTAPLGNVYTSPVAIPDAVNRTSFNGGTGGTQVQATPAELAAAREPHVAATAQQAQQENAARSAPSLRASANRGVPPVAATAHAGELTGSGTTAARRGSAPPWQPAAAAADEAAPDARGAAPRYRGPSPPPPARQTPPPPRPPTSPPATRPKPPEPKDEQEHRP
jgi:hypothetical protein